MDTKVVKIEDVKAQCAELARAGEILRAGELVAFPTETVYGLGANGFDAEACARIYAAKGRPSDNPLILHVSDRSMVDRVAQSVTPLAERLLAAFCPGPITLIMHRRATVPDRITGGLATVGVRMPENDIARAMIKAAGVPVAAPSANISGRPSPTTAESVLRDMQGRIPLILDGGPCHYGVESTIVDTTGDRALILRPGAITPEMLAEVLGGADYVALDPALQQLGQTTELDPARGAAQSAGPAPRAPGMKYRHYAPKAPLTLLEGAAADMPAAFVAEVRRQQAAGHTVGVLASREVCNALVNARVITPDLVMDYGSQGDLYAIAAHIYEDLIAFDDLPADVLLAEGTTSEGLGLAIMNRLHKASGFHSLQVPAGDRVK